MAMDTALDDVRALAARAGVVACARHVRLGSKPMPELRTRVIRCGIDERVAIVYRGEALHGPRWMVVDWQTDSGCPWADIAADSSIPVWVDVARMSQRVFGGEHPESVRLAWFDGEKWNQPAQCGGTWPDAPWTDATRKLDSDAGAIAYLEELSVADDGVAIVDPAPPEALAAGVWNVLVDPDFATHTATVRDGLETWVRHLRAEEPCPDALDSAASFCAALWTVLVPSSSRPVAPLADAEPLPAAQPDSGRILETANQRLIVGWALAAMREVAMDVPRVDRRIDFDDAGLYAATPDGSWARLLGVGEGQLVMCGRAAQAGLPVRTSEFDLLFPAPEDFPATREYPAWLPRNLIAAVTRREAGALAWTEGGSWFETRESRADGRRRTSAQRRLVADHGAAGDSGAGSAGTGSAGAILGLCPHLETALVGIELDRSATLVDAFESVPAPRSARARAEVIEMMTALQRFLSGDGVLGLSAQYPVAPEVAPLAHGHARATIAAVMADRMVYSSAMVAIERVLRHGRGELEAVGVELAEDVAAVVPGGTAHAERALSVLPGAQIPRDRASVVRWLEGFLESRGVALPPLAETFGILADTRPWDPDALATVGSALAGLGGDPASVSHAVAAWQHGVSLAYADVFL